MTDRIKEIKNIFLHKQAFMQVRNSNEFLKNNISFYRAIMHDTIKLLNVLIFGDDIATKIHRRFAGHHKAEKMTFKQKVEAFCDWECARYTKPEKPLNGRQTWLKFYSNVDMLDIITKFEKAQKN